MTPRQRELVDELFLDAADLPVTERNRVLNERCGDDDLVRREVESLLAHDGGADFLDSHGLPFRASDLLRAAGDNAIPERLGAYRILRRIGQGGAGTVYEAEQENPRRRVAVKVAHSGPGTAGLLRRFQREIEILGALTHPGIARVYDAGVAQTPQGKVSYLAMELVDGLPLTEFADRLGLGVRERLALVAEICDAVQFAHERGVIHRDLKPANILVPEAGESDGGAGNGHRRSTWQPKVLDFGVARLTGADVQLTLQRTNIVQLIGTIPYMSPEQVRGRSAELDARTDVYSLGVILYELLCGRLPLDVRDRSLAEAARIIQDGEPTRLSSINTVLRGDIETLTAKALEKTPARRFPTAAALAADIRRYLRNEPIRARPPSAVYQLRKFAQRNRSVVASVCVVILSLAAATAASVQFGLQEAAQRRVAERREHRANIIAAAAELENLRPAQARAILERASASQRSTWEWRHLWSRLDSSDRVLEAHCGAVNALAFSTDGSCLVSGSADQTLLRWNLADALPAFLGSHDGPVTALAVDPCGAALISAASDGTVRLWDSPFAEDSSTLDLGTRIRDLDFSTDGSLLAILISDSVRPSRSLIKVWDRTTGSSRADWRVSVGQPTHCCTFSSGDAGELMLANAHGVEIRSANDGVRLRRVGGAHDTSALDMARSSDGTRLVTGSDDKGVVLWSTNPLAVVHRADNHTGPVQCVTFSPSDDRIASGSNDQTVRLWDGQTGELRETLFGHTAPVRAVAISQDGCWLAAGGDDTTVRLWNLARVEQGTSFGVLRGHSGAVYDIACHPTEDVFVSAAWTDHTLRFWNSRTGDLIRTVAGVGSQEEIAWSPDGSQIAIGSWDLALLDVGSGKIRRLGNLGGRASSLAFNSHGDQIVTTASQTIGRRKTNVRHWDAASGELLAKEMYPCEALAAASSDGVRIAILESGRTRLADAATGREVCKFDGHAGQVERLRFSADGARFVTAGDDGTVGVWETRSGRKLATLRGHSERVYDAVFSPDGTRIASCSNDNSVRIWDGETYEGLLELRGHQRFVHALAFSRDGSALTSASGDGTVRLWRAPSPP